MYTLAVWWRHRLCYSIKTFWREVVGTPAGRRSRQDEFSSVALPAHVHRRCQSAQNTESEENRQRRDKLIDQTCQTWQRTFISVAHVAIARTMNLSSYCTSRRSGKIFPIRMTDMSIAR